MTILTPDWTALDIRTIFRILERAKTDEIINVYIYTYIYIRPFVSLVECYDQSIDSKIKCGERFLLPSLYQCHEGCFRFFQKHGISWDILHFVLALSVKKGASWYGYGSHAVLILIIW